MYTLFRCGLNLTSAYMYLHICMICAALMCRPGCMVTCWQLLRAGIILEEEGDMPHATLMDARVYPKYLQVRTRICACVKCARMVAGVLAPGGA